MKIRLWGTRGSLANASSETERYGGNTSCVSVLGRDGTLLVLDAGTGIRALGSELDCAGKRIDILLTHLHMDHLQGLGFFKPLYDPEAAVHIWGPSSTTLDLRARLARYLSPPLFPVRLRDLPCQLSLHDVPVHRVRVGKFVVTAQLVCHPGPTVGYRISEGRATVVYIPDHEPALATQPFPGAPEWTSGFDLAQGADLLIHDAQYTNEEYPNHFGWGHSTMDHALAFAELAGVKRLMPFHHDPSHDDRLLDEMIAHARAAAPEGLEIVAGKEGSEIDL